MKIDPTADLWLGMIESQILDVLEPENQGATPEERDAAFDWLMSDDDGPRTFMWAAEQLGLSDGIIRRIREKIIAT